MDEHVRLAEDDRLLISIVTSVCEVTRTIAEVSRSLVNQRFKDETSHSTRGVGHHCARSQAFYPRHLDHRLDDITRREILAEILLRNGVSQKPLEDPRLELWVDSFQGTKRLKLLEDAKKKPSVIFYGGIENRSIENTRVVIDTRWEQGFDRRSYVVPVVTQDGSFVLTPHRVEVDRDTGPAYSEHAEVRQELEDQDFHECGEALVGARSGREPDGLPDPLGQLCWIDNHRRGHTPSRIVQLLFERSQGPRQSVTVKIAGHCHVSSKEESILSDDGTPGPVGLIHDRPPCPDPVCQRHEGTVQRSTVNRCELVERDRATVLRVQFSCVLVLHDDFD